MFANRRSNLAYYSFSSFPLNEILSTYTFCNQFLILASKLLEIYISIDTI